MSARLGIEGLTAGYDRAAVIRDVSLTVDAGEVVALLGANGAGKTTTLRAVSGIVKPIVGRVTSTATTSRHCRRPLERVSGSRTCPRGAGCSSGSPWPSTSAWVTAASSSTRRSRTATSRSSRSCVTVAWVSCPAGSSRCSPLGGRSPAIPACCCSTSCRSDWRRSSSSTCSRSCATSPRESGCAVLLVEQHVHLALEVADRGYVLSHGEIVLQNSAEELRHDRQLLVASYLGERAGRPDERGRIALNRRALLPTWLRALRTQHRRSSPASRR